MIKQLNVWMSPIFPSCLASVTLIKSHQLSTCLQLPLLHPITLMKYHATINSNCLTSCDWLPQNQKANESPQCVSRWFTWSKVLRKHIFLFWWRKLSVCSACVWLPPLPRWQTWAFPLQHTILPWWTMLLFETGSIKSDNIPVKKCTQDKHSWDIFGGYLQRWTNAVQTALSL